MSDCDFEIDIRDYGVVTAVSSSAVAETRLETSAKRTDSGTAMSKADADITFISDTMTWRVDALCHITENDLRA